MSRTRPAGVARPLAAAASAGARTLHPGYFALVMATGIVSIAMRNERAYPISVVLL